MEWQRYAYFRCEWKIPSLSTDDIKDTFIGRGNGDCGLYFEAPIRNTEGYWTIGVIARVTSRQFLDENVSHFGAKAGLTLWLPVEEKWTAWRTLTVSATPDFIKGIQQFGRANAEFER